MKKLLIMLIVALFGFIILAGTAVVFFFMYKKECKSLESKIVNLQKFDVKEVKKEYVETQNWSLPLVTPTKTIEELNKEKALLIEGEYKKQSRAINVAYSKNIQNLIKTYSVVRVGSDVSIQLKDNTVVKGRVGKTKRGVDTSFVTIGTKEYAFKNIMPEYIHLFDLGKSNNIIISRRDELNSHLKEKQESLRLVIANSIGNQIFTDAGYVKKDFINIENTEPSNTEEEDNFSFGEDTTQTPVEEKVKTPVNETNSMWVSKRELLAVYLTQTEKDFYNERENTIKQLKEDNKFFGYIELQIKEK